MARREFVQQLRDLGYAVEERGEDRVVFRYVVPVGKFWGQEISLGFIVPGDFPVTPPSGPHISPRLLPVNAPGPHPAGGVHDSPQFGPEWEYWSRPFPDWGGTDRTVRAYLAHIRNLFVTQ